MPAGRPKILDETRKAQICAMLAVGCSLDSAAAYVGCCVKTVYNTCQTDLEFLYQMEHARVQAELDVLKSLRANVNSSWRAAAWLLQATEPGRYGRGAARDANMDKSLSEDEDDEEVFGKFGIPRPLEDFDVLPPMLPPGNPPVSSPLAGNSRMSMAEHCATDSLPINQV